MNSRKAFHNSIIYIYSIAREWLKCLNNKHRPPDFMWDNGCVFRQFYSTRYYNKWNVIFCPSVPCFEVMNKKWNESISHSARLHDARITYFPGTAKSSCKILPAKLRLEWLAGDYWGIKNRALYAEVKVPRLRVEDDSLAIPHGRPGLRDERVGWFNNVARSSEAPVERVPINHYCTTCARLCVFLCARVCLVHVVRSEHTV